MPVVKITLRERLEAQKKNERYFKLSVKVLGWSQIADAFIYIALLAYSFSSTIPTDNKTLIILLQGLLSVVTVGTLAYGIILIIAAYEESPDLIEIGLMMCLFLALINLFLSIVGIFVYSGSSLYSVHFIVMLVYIYILIEILWSICYNFPHLVIYQELLNMEPPSDEPSGAPRQPAKRENVRTYNIT